MLNGIKIVEFSTMVAGPSAAGLMADWGAEVIKIEPHRGDPMRGAPNSILGTINFDLHNRGKRSIALDTNAPRTREIILRLVERADLFITNMLPKQLEKVRLDWHDIREVNPRIVVGGVSSFGRFGPDKDRGATDNLGFWARGGGTHLLTVKGQEPIPIRQSVGDRITGMTACAGMLAALLQAQRTGQGCFVDTSLLSAGLWSFSTDVSNQLNRGRVATSKNRHGAALPLSNYFKTKDERWIQIHTQIGPISKALGIPELENDPHFATPDAIRQNGPALVDLIDSVFSRFTLEELKPRLEEAGARYEPVQSTADVAEDPQVRAMKMIQPSERDGETQWQVANPWTLIDGDAFVTPAPGSAPKLGEHTIEILLELGYSKEDIAMMETTGEILPRPSHSI
ncbi:MAG: CoA transferase [Caulobacterales bacterium]